MIKLMGIGLVLRVFGFAAMMPFLTSTAAAAEAPDAPSAADISARLKVIEATRQRLLSDYKLGELMMRNARLEDAALKVEEEALRARLSAPKTQPKSTPKSDAEPAH